MYWQTWHVLAAIATVGSCALASPSTPWVAQGNASIRSAQTLGIRDMDTCEFDPSDLSHITTLAAIGDSYSAGIGAGDRLGNIGQAFSTGSVIANVLDDQIPKPSDDQQLILLSAGGNDAELSNVLNQCIYQWTALNPLKVAAAKAKALYNKRYGWLAKNDFDILASGCDKQLARTKRVINGEAFGRRLDFVIAAAKRKLGSNGMIYYTGYAKIWAEDLSTVCDSVSWSTWNHDDPEMLTSAHRKKMNDLVDEVNSQISAAVDRAGSQVKFVNYDSYVGYFNGRFCEAGVDESPSDSTTRDGLMFYELSKGDPFGSNPYKRSQDYPENGTFEGSVNQYAAITLLLDPDGKLSQQTSVSDDTLAATLTESKLSLTAASAITDYIPNILPDGSDENPLPMDAEQTDYGRVFHPHVTLHELIANLVIYEMTNKNQVDHGYPEIPEQFTLDSCPWTPVDVVDNDSGESAGGQQIALASYINPLADPAAWTRMIDYTSDKVSVLVANVLNGPDTTVNEDWEKVILRANAAGKRVLGYMRTGYLGVSNDHFQTRLGSADLADWVLQIQTDIDLWYTLYPGMVGGIFFDEGWNQCGDNNKYAELYRFITDYTKRMHPGAFTVLNPGATMPQCFEHSADTLMTFENSYDTYVNNYTPNPDWTPSDPRELWHIIYNVTSDDVAKVAALALERGAGLIHITDDNLPNPYDTLPNDDYMQIIMKALDGGKPAVADPTAYETNGASASAPISLAVTTTDYSSVSLSWGASSPAPYAYSIYQNGKEVVRLPGSMTKVTIGNIDHGISISFTVRAIGAGGSVSADSNEVTATTLEMPNNQPVTNVKAGVTASKTTVKADILIPYAFQRVFLTDPDTACAMPAWPINYNLGNYICTHYMVENGALFKYTGAALAAGETNYPWAWTTIDTIAELPIGSDAIDPNYFVVDAQGYGPPTNDATLSAGAYCTGKAPYDCKGEPLCSTLNVKWCDKAVNQMNRGVTVYTANPEALALSGNC
ncbi:fibronectin type III domain protein [Aspergillus uvarum CBS 121591]|uniref:Fibronectin type III domain protein n=1 Tax=Aspergillus uvarum CBS 121591 TaxID=1448315 RepID=A0A319CB60_9EURO|nr:fibronectin type III domain protein [Aspergillus uvarum CBS 121591]PYH81051.1 fibronectin type III domain protein [Aspergillus uvarum CBS 121591]